MAGPPEKNSLCYCWKSGQNLWKSGWNGVQCCLTSKNGAQGFQKNTWRPFLEVTLKKGLLWEKICRQSCTKTLRGSLGKFGRKSFAPPNIFLLLHLRWKSTSAPVAPLLKGQRDNSPRHASILRSPYAYYIVLHILFYTHSHRRSHAPPKIFRTYSHFVPWEAVSQTK